MTTHATTARPKGASRPADWLIPAGLIALVLIPILAGSVRLTTLALHPVATPQNIRFVASPIPVVLHIISATIYSLLGAFQFSPGFRRRYPAWHRAAGRVLIAAGLVAALAGLWMATFYAIVPADSTLLHAFRLFFGSAMIVSVIFGLTAIQRRNISQHQAWMCRAYAIGIGAGTQALVQIPSTIVWGKPDANTLALLMGGAWVINLVIAEWLIHRHRSKRPEFGTKPTPSWPRYP